MLTFSLHNSLEQSDLNQSSYGQSLNGRALPSHNLKVMISAGESSGDMHGAALVQAARQMGLPWDFVGLGGDKMAQEGVHLLGHVRDVAVMGISEVLGSLGKILTLRNKLKDYLRTDPPGALVLIDSPDFNLSLAKYATRLGIPVIYYICPSVWAWRSGRLEVLAQATKRRALLFKFEKDFYQARGVSADWVGHPLLDEMPDFPPQNELKASLGFAENKPLLAILPGSRRKTLAKLAPIFCRTAELLLKKQPGLQLALAQGDTIDSDFLNDILMDVPSEVRASLKIVSGRSQALLAAADAAILASGTSSVEATILQTPHVVAYKVSSLSFALARLLVKVKWVTIANLLAGREVVPEFLQERARPEILAEALGPLLAGENRDMADQLAEVSKLLGSPGASRRVVEIIADEIIADEIIAAEMGAQ